MSSIFVVAGHSFKELVRKKDFYVLLFLFCGLVAFFYNKAFFGVSDVSRYLKDAGYTLIMLFSMIICITFSAKQIPSEIESKTIYPLLAKPISRTHFVLGKFFGSVAISVSSFSLFYLLYLSVIIVKGEGALSILILQAYLFSMLLLLLLSAITVFFSMFLTVSANITLSFLIYFLTYCYNDVAYAYLLRSNGRFLSVFNGILYYLLPHFEFYNIKIRLVHVWDPLPAWVVLTVIVYTLLYVSGVMGLACLVFKRKNL